MKGNEEAIYERIQSTGGARFVKRRQDNEPDCDRAWSGGDAVEPMEGAGGEGLASLFEDEHTEIEGMRADYERRIEDLYSEIGRLTTKLTWLQKKSGLDVDAH